MRFRRCLAARHQLRRNAVASRASVSEASTHNRWLTEVAQIPAPTRMEALLRVLKAQGHAVVNPSEKANLHPLAIPLTVGQPILTSSTEPTDASLVGSELYVCLLAWPCAAEHEGMELPVVAMSSGAPSVRLLARSVDEYLHRVLAVEDVEGQSKALAEAAGDMGATLYKAGDAAAFGKAKLDAYLTTKAGKYCDVAEKLVFNHLAKGDQMSSLITGEWYMRKLFNGWARPFEFNAQHMLRCGHAEEARDTARMALRMPWWTLQQGYETTLQLAQIPGTPREVFRALNDEGGTEGKIQQATVAGRSNQEVAILSAELLMNLIAASGDGTWDDARQDLAAHYTDAGLMKPAGLIQAVP
eukprot:jgi/Tetstr1/459123/TSEL_004571.t1